MSILRYLSLRSLAVGLLATTLSAAPTVRTSGPTCTDFKIPVSAQAPTKILRSIPKNLDDPTVLTDFVVAQATSLLTVLLGIGGAQITSGTYNMSMRYCEPEVHIASRSNTIQYLQHAITNTKNYWNGLTYPEGYMGETYSWIDYASKQGYPTLSVDNLGSGDSDRADPLLVVQMSLQVEIIHQILLMLRQGTIPNPVLAGKPFSKIIYAGHSYGSICGNGIATFHPTDVDTFIYTGYSGQFAEGLVPLAAGIAEPAFLAMPNRFASFVSQPAYLAQSIQEGRRIGLYTNVGGYDPDIVTYDFTNEGTVAVGELASLFYGLGAADEYTGDILVVTGKQDAICCNKATGPDCGSGPNSIPAQAGAFFPSASNYTVYIPDLTGHSANLHYSSPEMFKVAHQYLADRGY